MPFGSSTPMAFVTENSQNKDAHGCAPALPSARSDFCGPLDAVPFTTFNCTFIHVSMAIVKYYEK